VHTASFWNITVQWTSHDDLTENSKTAKKLVKCKDDVQTGIFDSPVIVLQANWELYTSDRGEIRVY
jgi:hypothetical protein